MRAEDRAAVERLIRERKFIPGGRYLYAAGRELHQTQNCALYRCGDSREEWAALKYKALMSLMTGAGIGIDYGSVRPCGSPIKKTGGVASGPLSMMQMINEDGRHTMQGGSRRSAIWAGLPWSHRDVWDFIRIKDWSADIRQRKEQDFEHPAPLDMTNISVQLDDGFFHAYDRGDLGAHELYEEATRMMFRTAEPGFSVDVGSAAGETLRNACTEVTSRDDSDICNLGSLNLARIEDLAEMKLAVRYATLFLLAGTVYSHVPHGEIEQVRSRNRRLGLGLMGVHEWLLKRGKPYAPDAELERWLEEYEYGARTWANDWARQHKLSRPIATRAVAPTGTIGIIGETTTGIEPIFCVAYKRRFKEAQPGVNRDVTRYQYVVDPTARRLIASGVEPSSIEDAYTIGFEDRVAFQAWIQGFVDQGVSSTINIPHPVTDEEERKKMADILYRYLPRLRGITVYPDGARGGQPLTPVPYEEAVGQEGVTFIDEPDRCAGGACGI